MKKKLLIFVALLSVLMISVFGMVSCFDSSGGDISAPESESESLTDSNESEEEESKTDSESVDGESDSESVEGESDSESAEESESESDSESVEESESESESVPAVPTYTVKFVDADGTELSSETYEEGAEIAVPADPSKEDADGYSYTFTGWDAEVAPTATADVTYTATYSRTAIEYTITFLVDGEPVGEAVFTVETESIEEPTIPDVEHYVGSWSYDLTNLANQDATLVYSPIDYKIEFVDEEGFAILAPIKFNVENIDEVVLPEVPADCVKEGYTGSWDIAVEDLQLENCEARVVLTANVYHVTFDANGGSVDVPGQDVEFDADYELPTPTPAKAYEHFAYWIDEEGNAVELSGVWTIAGDVTLTAVYTDVMTFEDGAIPEDFSATDTASGLEIVEKDGGNVLQITSTGGGPAMKATVDFLKAYFDDPTVDYIAFDAKGDVASNNFRRDTKHSNGSLNAVTYEHDMTFTHPVEGLSYPTTGIRSDAWKTFYFSRADYDFWVSQGLTSARFIASGGFAAGKNIYIDNLRPCTAAEREAGKGSFESGGVRINDANGKTLLMYMLDEGGTWQFNIQVSNGGFTNVGYTNDNVTHGKTALTFTKESGNLSFNFTSGRTFYDNLVTATGYFALDVYVPVDSDAKLSFHTTTYPGPELKKGGWTTVYVKDSKNQVIFVDTTGGTYCVDNLRSITEAEYYLGAFGFEANAGGLRTSNLGDDTTNSGVCYYYGGADHDKNTFSFAIAEGNGEKDLNVLSNVRLASDIVHDGSYALAFDKGNGYMYLTMRNDSAAFAKLSGGFTFWIYSTVDIDGVNSNFFINGNNAKFNGGEGIFIPANTWTQVTVTAADMNPTRFLILQGNWAGTIYLDGFAPLA